MKGTKFGSSVNYIKIVIRFWLLNYIVWNFIFFFRLKERKDFSIDGRDYLIRRGYDRIEILKVRES